VSLSIPGSCSSHRVGWLVGQLVSQFSSVSSSVGWLVGSVMVGRSSVSVGQFWLVGWWEEKDSVNPSDLGLCPRLCPPTAHLPHQGPRLGQDGARYRCSRALGSCLTMEGPLSEETDLGLCSNPNHGYVAAEMRCDECGLAFCYGHARHPDHAAPED
jgi:hypothetical protein